MLNRRDFCIRIFATPAMASSIKLPFARTATETTKGKGGFPLSEYTPYGYLDNPFHSWNLHRSGVLRLSRLRLRTARNDKAEKNERRSTEPTVLIDGFCGRARFHRLRKNSPRHQTASAGAEALVHSMRTYAGLKARSSTALARVLKFFRNLFSRALPGSIHTGV